MNRKTLLIAGALLISISSFSEVDIRDIVIIMKGNERAFPVNSVEVTMGKDNTLTTTFNKDIDNVTITVKKQSGEVVSVESLDAKEWDVCPTTIPDYKEGEYIIEISTPEGELIGSF